MAKSDQQTCRICLLNKPIEEYFSRSREKYREGKHRTMCKACNRIRQRKNYLKYKISNPFKHKCNRARSRATVCEVAFDLTPEYLESIWTGFCPITGVELKWETNRSDENAAELDRLVPEKGYVQGNVCFISRKMNRLKNSASLNDLKLLCKWIEEKYEQN